jgi:hypothetical protein
VRVIPGAAGMDNVGAIKRFACDHCKGNAFIELDHDDVLVPGNTLSLLKSAFETGAGFAYSDTAVFRYKPGKPATFEPFTYAAAHGWQTYPVRVYGRQLQASRNFEITPRALCEIFYCPDHVRAWSREAYYAAGGHDASLPVCDDHQLMIKTYLTGARFRHIGGCRYLYRNHAANTVLARNAKIQELTRQNRQTYLPELVSQWTDRSNFPVCDISQLRKRGWTFDRDLMRGFGYDALGHVTAYDELQRAAPWQVREFMHAVWHALVPGGYLTITVPEVSSGAGYVDVEWQSRFGAATMLPYTSRVYAEANGKVNCRFQEVDCLEFYPTDWHKQKNFKYLRFVLCALKGQRQPGLQFI